ncbi:hypothetical protein Tco_0075539 [Tanacetum coccineum]
MISLLIHHGGSFRKFSNREYREGKTDMFDFVDIDYFSVHELDAMVLQLGYDGIDELMYYHYLRPMTDLDIVKLPDKSHHREIPIGYRVEASSASPTKNELLMLEWYDNSTPAKASSNTCV